MIYELVKESDPILKNEIELFDFKNPQIDPVEISHILAQSMLDKNGIGLAANQIGLSYRVFAIKANPIIVCFNPRIVDYSEDQIYLEEGCLTYSGLYVKIKRPEVIKVRYTKPNGETITTKFQGLTARVFQHEMDHLNGINFLSRANKYHLEQAKKKRDNEVRNNLRIMAKRF